ncbi:hypothetical protein HGG75_04755 [Ochrobactrum pseudogrignonense]|nr:hypothetical protein [Brucella pseudogrignonensis]
MLHARHAALAIVGTGRDPDRAETALTVSEDIIFASGRPSILLPTFWQSDGAVPETIVVGWNASREAARAIADSMAFRPPLAPSTSSLFPSPRSRGFWGGPRKRYLSPSRAPWDQGDA